MAHRFTPSRTALGEETATGTSVSINPPAPPKPGFLGTYTKPLLFLVAILVAVLVAALPITGLSHDGKITLAAFSFVVVLWIGEVLPAGISAVLFCTSLVVILGNKMPVSVAFGGFATSTTWLLIGAFLLGQATVGTGVANRIAYLIMRLGRGSHRRVLIYLWISQIVLALLTPSTTVRAAMYIPITMGIVQAYRAQNDSRFAANLLAHVFWGMHMGSLLWYTGTIMNPQIMGILRAETGYGPSYFVYVAWNIIPCAILTVAVFTIIEWVMPAEKEISETGNLDILDQKLAEMGRMSADEWKALAFFLVAIALWATEKIHHIETAWVAVGLGGLLFLPKAGVLKKEVLNRINWDIVLLMAVALGIINIMKQVTLDTWVTDRVLAPILNPLASRGASGLAFGITIATALVHLIAASAVGETALMGPLVIRYAHLMGYNPTLAALVVVKAEMNVFIFPYQMTPLLVLWGTGYMDMKKCLRIFGATCAFSIVWIVAMAPLWEWLIRTIK